ncbi:hypothetical protein [Pseudoalteromonas ulvae]|uniref:Uncharacterized protein n=1 Tax=Pseudoalteromonas ulvae TaxID=107327 RepID=A0A244CUW7_PSEDV|nr:hypothetical protein [Pseudoalteromonas ulvae]OUL59371.1 hypothetical protein B1199_03630 [Pseudoalteromonas ulvae]
MIWQKAGNVIEKARKTGALHPISATTIEHEVHNVHFTYHLRNQLAEKKPHQLTQTSNPFLPHEAAMFVDSLGDNHKVLLNKFPVLSPHLLVCSNTFINQSQALTESDLNAWHDVLSENNASQTNTHRLGFFNSAPTAGASQPHRHMQVIEVQHPLTPFMEAFQQWLPNKTLSLRYSSPMQLYQAYQEALQRLSLLRPDQDSSPHNILLTEHNIWLIPRSDVQYLGIYANGLNFSGHFLLKDQTQLDWLKTQNPFDILAKLIKV